MHKCFSIFMLITYFQIFFMIIFHCKIYLRYKQMSENTYNQNIQDGKPVNINISFNISRKQVTQNLPLYQQQKSFNLKNNSIEDDSLNNIKSKNPSFRPTKTPELSQTDRNIYSKDLQIARPTQQLKRKKKRKRSSIDYTADKTSFFPFYPNDLDKSLPTHKRGYTTVLVKKPVPGTATKIKRQNSKVQQTKNRISSLIQHGKSQSKPVPLQKSLKGIINKLINNELSKRSLPLPANKSKYNQSQSLTTHKLPSSSTGKSNQKKKSKTNIGSSTGSNSLNQKQKLNQSSQQKRHSSDPAQQKSILTKNDLLEKLSNFKSVQNSLLISQVDRMQQKQDISNQLSHKLLDRKRIVIKTDQSIQCIDQIHNYEKNKFKDEFFNINANNNYIPNNISPINLNHQKNNSTNSNMDKNQLLILKKTSQTQYLIQTYINLLNQQQEQLQQQQQYQEELEVKQLFKQENNNSLENKNKQTIYDDHKHKKQQKQKKQRNNQYSNGSQKVEIYDGNENYLNQSDYFTVEYLLNSRKPTKKSNNESDNGKNNEKNKEKNKGKNILDAIDKEQSPKLDLMSKQRKQLRQVQKGKSSIYYVQQQQNDLSKSINQAESEQQSQNLQILIKSQLKQQFVSSVKQQKRQNQQASLLKQQKQKQKQPQHIVYDDQQQNNLQYFQDYQNNRQYKKISIDNQKQKHLSLSDNKPHHTQQLSPQKQQNDQDNNFKPFISSQMGREMMYGNNKQSSYSNNVNNEQRAKINQIKKHEIEKWGYLLEYIKSNMNKESNTQEVLEQVYQYLSQAKVDLIRQGQQVMQNKHAQQRNHFIPDSKKKQRLQEEFTNKLSSQYDKSSVQYSKQSAQYDKSSVQEIQIRNDNNMTILKQQNKNNIKENNYFQNIQNNRLQRQQKPQVQVRKQKSQRLKQQRQKSHQQQILDQQIKSFKDQYQSEENDQEIKFMNLETIESALKNRFKILNEKKQKELQNLEITLDQKKVSIQSYEQQKASIQKWFKHETNEILLVKKNIWKGYNQAKGILDKSYINSRFQQEYKSKQKSGNKNDRSADKKNKTMMKCLSQSYLNKKRVDYKKFIQQEEKKREEEDQSKVLRRSRDYQDEESDEQDKDEIDDQQYEGQNSHQQYEDNSQHHRYEDSYNQPQDEDQSQSHDKKSSKQSYNNEFSQQSQKYSQQISRQRSTEKSKQQSDQLLISSNNGDEEMEKINRKLNKLKEQHLQSLALQQRKQVVVVENIKALDKKGDLSDQQQQRQKLRSKLGQLHSLHEPIHHTYSPQQKASPMSPASIHYEQLQKQLHSNSQQQQQDSGDYIHEYYDEEKDLSNDDQDFDQENKIVEEEVYDSKIHSKQRKLKNKIFVGQPKLGQKEIVPADQFAAEKEDPKAKKVAKSQGQQLSPEQQQNIHSPQTQKSSQIVHTNAQKLLSKKFKYLTQQDKQDIFQFLFLDLCIQLYQQPCYDNRIMTSINSFVSKQYEISKRKKGVKTNLNVVKDYLKRFCGYIVRTNKKTLDNMNVPMGPTAIQMLRYMHENDDIDEEPIDQSDGVVTLIIPVAMFDTFERSLLPTLQFEKYYQNEQKEQERITFLKNVLHIHNKALFDALNQFLDQQRPFGIWGKPFPWKKSSSFAHNFTQIQHQQKLKKSAQKVVQACSYVCGLLVDKQQSLIGNAKISEGYIQQIRQDRISRMLANDMIENEDRWVFYDDQQTEVLVQAGNYIYHKILKQCMDELAVIQNRCLQQAN